jgi:hypothetical protein
MLKLLLLQDLLSKIKSDRFSMQSGLSGFQIYNENVQAEGRAMLGSNLSAAWSSEAARRGLTAPPALYWCSFGLQSDKSQGVWGTESPKHLEGIHLFATQA